MSEMVEKVARALCAASSEQWRSGTYQLRTGPNFEWEDHEADDLNNHWRSKARAAIEAMREPTISMIDAGDFREAGNGPDLVAAMYHAMIDAALKEE